MQDGHKPGHLRAVADVVGGIAGLPLAVDHAVHPGIDEGEGAQHQIVHAGDALAGHDHGNGGKQQVVVNQRGAVAHLNEHIAVEHGAAGVGPAFGLAVVVHQVLADARALGLPIAPYAHDAVVNVVAADGHVDGGVQLDARRFRAAQLLGIADMVNMAILNGGKHAAHAAHDAGLLAVVHFAPADDVAAHLFLQPPVVLAPAHGVPLHLGGGFDVLGVKVHIVFRVPVLAQGNAAAAAVADFAVLNDPALGPVGADHAVLIGGGRGPGGGGLLDIKTAHGDIAHAGLVRHKAVAPHVDLHFFFVGVLALEIGKQHGFLAFLAAEPLVSALLRLPAGGIDFALDALLQTYRLIHHQIVDIYRAGMPHRGREIPVAAHEGGIGIVRPENAVIHPGRPDIALIGHPALHFLRTGDHRAQGDFAAVGDATVLRARVAGIDVFPVDARGHDDLVPGHGHPGRVVDVAEGHFLAAVAVLGGVDVHIVSHGQNLLISSVHTGCRWNTVYHKQREIEKKMLREYCLILPFSFSLLTPA